METRIIIFHGAGASAEAAQRIAVQLRRPEHDYDDPDYEPQTEFPDHGD